MSDIIISKEVDDTVDIEDNENDDDELDFDFNQTKKSKIMKKPFKKLKSNRFMNMLKPKPKIPNNNFKDFNDSTFESFSNPQKRIPEIEEQSEIDIEEDDNDGVDMPEYDGDDNIGYGDEGDSEDPVPSSGYQTLEDEKQDLLFKFHRLEQKGLKTKKFTIHSDIREMRSEFNKIKKDAETNSGVKFSKRMLMAVVSGLEFLNKRYDPLTMELNGWSESVMENMNDGDYDNVLEKLHEKYSGKVNTPPEIELMLSLTGSAIMFHMTSSMFKSVGPSISELTKNNPTMMQDIMKNMMSKNNGKEENDDHQQKKEEREEEHEEGTRRTMKGPSVDLSSFGGMLNTPPQPINTSSDIRENMFDGISTYEPEDKFKEVNQLTNSPAISLSSEPVSLPKSEIREVSLSSNMSKTRRRKKKSENAIDLDL